jgi:hypothetical protein
MPVFTSSIEVTADYPTIKPSLNLNFARARSLDPRITFTRASVGTYVGRDGLIKTAGEDEPRFDHDPDTLESLGLLIEESRTNIHSSQGSLTGTTNPEGITGGQNFINWSAESYTARRQRLQFSYSLSAGTYTLSFYTKLVGQIANPDFVVGSDMGPDSLDTLRIQFIGLTGDLANDTYGGSITIPTVVQKLPNDWYRVQLTATYSGSGTGFFYWYPSGTNTVSVDTNTGFYVWGVQLEAGSFPTSYIPTSGSTVTRQDDFGSITGESFSNFFNQSEGTFDVGYKLGDDNTSMRVAQVSNANSNTVIDLVVGSGGGAGGYWYIMTGGVVQFSSPTIVNSSQVDRNFRAVLAYKENDCVAQNNKTSAEPTTDTSVTLATDYNKLLFYAFANNGDHIQGHLKFIRYYPKRLTNAQVTLFSQD